MPLQHCIYLNSTIFNFCEKQITQIDPSPLNHYSATMHTIQNTQCSYIFIFLCTGYPKIVPFKICDSLIDAPGFAKHYTEQVNVFPWSVQSSDCTKPGASKGIKDFKRNFFGTPSIQTGPKSLNMSQASKIEDMFQPYEISIQKSTA